MRRRILLLVVGVTALVVLAFAIPLVLLTRDSVVRDAEHAMVTRAQAVAYAIRGNPTTADLTTDLASYEQTSSRSVSVTLPNGTVLGTLPASVGSGSANGEGFPNGGNGG